nr:immunoglobulin heavy chain junction region [Macaca mulatta]
CARKRAYSTSWNDYFDYW